MYLSGQSLANWHDTGQHSRYQNRSGKTYVLSVRENCLPQTHGHGEAILQPPASRPCVWAISAKHADAHSGIYWKYIGDSNYNQDSDTSGDVQLLASKPSHSGSNQIISPKERALVRQFQLMLWESIQGTRRWN